MFTKHTVVISRWPSARSLRSTPYASRVPHVNYISVKLEGGKEDTREPACTVRPPWEETASANQKEALARH